MKKSLHVAVWLAIFVGASLASAACSKAASAPAASPAVPAPFTEATATPVATEPVVAVQPSQTRFNITVTNKGFEPTDIQVPAGKPVQLIFERKVERTCAKKVVLTLADGQAITKDLPLNTPVEIAVTFPVAGTLTYACGMDMYQGQITVQ